MAAEPYPWAAVGQLFEPADGAALAASFPTDHFRKFAGYDGEKGYEYRARSFIPMGSDVPSHQDALSLQWQRLAADLLSPAYRQALMQLTGLDLRAALMEANITEYGAGAWLGPHVDLREKLVTHVLYFNQQWNPDDGGCLRILRSPDPADVAREMVPVINNSVVLVRSDRSWHAVSRVCGAQRRAVNVIFHLPGSISTMWPAQRMRQRRWLRLYPRDWRVTLGKLKRAVAKL
jgi:hypothetical protein